MKFSRKMILVPATGREEPENEKMSELDQEMSAIIKNPKLSTKEKVEMYNEVLRRNLIFESRLLQKPIANENKMEIPSDVALNTIPATPVTPVSSNISNVTNFMKNSPAGPTPVLSTDFKKFKQKLERKLIANNDDDDNFTLRLSPDEEEEEEDTTAKKLKFDDDDTYLWEEFNPTYYNLGGTSRPDYFESESSMQKSQDKKKKQKKIQQKNKKKNNASQ
jgi:hypothetical protein